MPEMEKIKIPNFTMKMQLYPSAVQKEALDKIFHALHIAYNITFHEVFQKNPMVGTTPDGEGNVWPDFKKMATKEWKDRLKKIQQRRRRRSCRCSDDQQRLISSRCEAGLDDRNA